MNDPELLEMLDAALADPAKAATIDADLDARFGCDLVVVVIDMSGFSRLTREQKIGGGLLAIRRLQHVAVAHIEAQAGEVVKFVADNVFATFPTVRAAQLAAAGIVATLPASIGIGAGRILRLPADFFGCEVNSASRLGEDVAQEGQVLLTEAAQHQQCVSGPVSAPGGK